MGVWCRWAGWRRSGLILCVAENALTRFTRREYFAQHVNVYCFILATTFFLLCASFVSYETMRLQVPGRRACYLHRKVFGNKMPDTLSSRRVQSRFGRSAVSDTLGVMLWAHTVHTRVTLNNNKFYAIFNFSRRKQPDDLRQCVRAKWNRGLHTCAVRSPHTHILQ